MKAFFTLLVLVVVCGGIFALGSFKQDSTGKTLLNVAEEVALTVNVASPERGEIIRLVQAPGDVEAVLEVDKHIVADEAIALWPEAPEWVKDFEPIGAEIKPMQT